MPAVNIAPPYLGYDASNSPRGEYWAEKGAAQYAFLRQGATGAWEEMGVPTNDSADQKFHALKSIDGGVTWVEQDAANAPLTSRTIAETIQVGADTVCRDGNSVYLVDITGQSEAFPVGDPVWGYPVVFNGVQVWKFDLTTDTWSAATQYASPVPGPLARYSTPGGQAALQLVRRGPGDMLLVYNGPWEQIGALSDQKICARIYVCPFDGTSFGAPVIAPGQAGKEGYFILGRAGCDSSGITHISAYASGGDYVTPAYVHIAVGADNSFGSFQSMPGESFGDELGTAFSEFVEFGPYVGFTNIAGWTEEADPQGPLTLYYAPSGALEPEWLSIPVSNNGPVDPLNAVPTKTTALAVLGDQLYCVWLKNDLWNGMVTYPPNGRYQYATAPIADPTTWSEDALLFEATGGTAPEGAGKLRASQVFCYPASYGFAVLALSYGADSGGDPPVYWADLESADIYAVGGAPEPPVLTCEDPPSGVVGTPYSHQMGLSGGTPPYTVAITAGALPDGLSIDNAALITGTPTVAGTFVFTVQVTDSNALTDTVTCSITITAPPTPPAPRSWILSY